MKAWRYTGVTGGMEKNLQLKTDIPRPYPSSLTKGQVLIETIAVGLNPADYKVPEMPILGNLIMPRTVSPCLDFCGRISATHASVTSFQEGQTVLGRLDKMSSPMITGVLSEFIVASEENVAALPESVDADGGSTLPTVGLGMYQAMVPWVKSGQKIFINGGSGGTGTIGIQLAKSLGLQVTTSCSAANIGLCKELGADEVLDYKASPVLEQLKAKGRVFDHVVDNIGSDAALYKNAHLYMKPGAQFVLVGSEMKALLALGIAGSLPSFLGGGSQPFKMMVISNNAENLRKFTEWVGEGKIKPVIDEVFSFDDAPKAFEKLKTGRTKGKIVIHVGKS
jgi:NADPH:quinone reductase-like Zn-dependent oxidoreductase